MATKTNASFASSAATKLASMVFSSQGSDFRALAYSVEAVASTAVAVARSGRKAALRSSYAIDYANRAVPQSIASDIWFALQIDASALEHEEELQQLPLWLDGMPDAAYEFWQRARAWLEAEPYHEFWLRWYSAILVGKPLTGDWLSHRKMLEEIALLPDEDWEKGAEHIAELIAEIEAKYQPAKPQPVAKLEPLQIDTTKVQAALKVNRLTLPPTLEAVYGHLELEIRRLQGINHWPSPEAQDEARDLVRRLLAMAEAIQTLKKQTEALAEEPAQEDAEQAKGLLSKYWRSLRSWPDGKEDELSDATWRLGLIGVSAGVFALFGAPALAGTAVGGMVFGAKYLEQGAKAVKATRIVSGESAEGE